MSDRTGEAPAQELPAGWAWAELGDLGEWYGGSTPSKGNAANWNGDVPWISPKDMKQDRIGETADHLTQIALANGGPTLVPSGAVVMVVRSGILRHTVPLAVTDVPATLNQDMKALVPYEGIDPDYLCWALRALQGRILETCTKHGTTVHNIVTGSLHRLAIPVAPHAEQRCIVEKIQALLSDIANGVESLDAVDRKLASYRQSVLKAAVTGELVSGSTEDGPGSSARELLESFRQQRAKCGTKGAVEPDLAYGWSVPEHWEWASLDMLSWDTSYGSSKKCEPNGVGIPVLRIPNVRSGIIVRSDIKRFRDDVPTRASECLQPGDLLVIRTNGSEDLIGRGALVLDDRPEPEFFASYLVRFRLVGDALIHRWVNLVWQTPMLRQMVLAKGASSAGQYNLSQSKLRPFPIPIPPRNEISAIIEKVEEALSAISVADIASSSEGRRANSLRRSILNAAFAGRLVLQDPNDEPAAELLARIRDQRAQAVKSSGRGGRRRKTKNERATA